MTALAPVLMCLMTGCATLPGGGFTPPWKKTDAAKVDGPKDQITLTAGGGMKREVIDSAAQQELEGAKRLFEDKKFAQAEPIFHKLARSANDAHWWEIGPLAPAEPKTIEPESDGYTGKRVGAKQRSRGLNPVTEAALFYEAECQRMQKNYREAIDTYTKLLVEAPRTQYTQRACQGMFEIADYWLEPTRRQMDEYQKQIKGERWFVTPASYIHFTKDMPFLDTEGHASIVLNTVRLHDIKGPLGEKALLYLGTINFYRQDYKEADFYFTQLGQEYKDGPYAAKAIKQSVICKQLMTGGSVYDCRGVEESKKLLMRAQAAYPELAKDEDWVRMQLTSINIQQADRDFKVAEFYQRTGHPGSAYFYYELVCRRYPGTTYADRAEQRKGELKARVEKEQKAPLDVPARTEGNPAVQRPESFVPPPPRTLPPGLEGGTRNHGSGVRMKSIRRGWAIVVLLLPLCALAGCESGGHFTLLSYTTKPPFDETIRTVYVPIPQNVSWMRDLEFDLQKAVLNELNTRAGAPRVTSDCNRADTELVMKIVNTTKSTVLINQSGENRNAELGIHIEVVWRDLRPGHVGDILSNKQRFDPQEKPLPGDPAALAPPPIPYLVTPIAQYIPELGGSNNVAYVYAARSGARQIVNMMETWR